MNTETHASLPRGGWARVIAIGVAGIIAYFAASAFGLGTPWQLATVMALACQLVHVVTIKVLDPARLAALRTWPLIAQTIAMAASLWILFELVPSRNLPVSRVLTAAVLVVAVNGLAQMMIMRRRDRR